MKKSIPRRTPQVIKKSRPARTTRRGRAKTVSAAPPGKYVLRLFVAGATDKSRVAILRARQLCEAELRDNCVLEVVDIYQQPKLARANQIVATPTLIVEFPTPVRRFIGSLTNLSGLFVGLDLIAENKIAR